MEKKDQIRYKPKNKETNTVKGRVCLVYFVLGNNWLVY